jgi:hypothetical protein
MPDVFGEPAATTCVFFTQAAGASDAPGIPCALSRGGTMIWDHSEAICLAGR